MSSEYRRITQNGEPSIPGESLSLLEYTLGTERCAMRRFSKRSLAKRINDLESARQEEGLVGALLNEGIYYPLLKVWYIVF